MVPSRPTNAAQQTDTKPHCKLSCVFHRACIPLQSREHPFPFQTSPSIISATPPLTEYLQTYPYINRSKKSNYIFYQTATGSYDDPLRSQPRPPTSQGPRYNNVYMKAIKIRNLQALWASYSSSILSCTGMATIIGAIPHTKPASARDWHLDFTPHLN